MMDCIICRSSKQPAVTQFQLQGWQQIQSQWPLQESRLAGQKIPKYATAPCQTSRGLLTRARGDTVVHSAKLAAELIGRQRCKTVVNL